METLRHNRQRKPQHPSSTHRKCQILVRKRRFLKHREGCGGTVLEKLKQSGIVPPMASMKSDMKLRGSLVGKASCWPIFQRDARSTFLGKQKLIKIDSFNAFTFHQTLWGKVPECDLRHYFWFQYWPNWVVICHPVSLATRLLILEWLR